MLHVWLRAEERANEKRTPLMPEGARELLALGWSVSVESNKGRIVPDKDYKDAGCTMVTSGSWRTAPADAVILGLKELPDDGTPISHQHIMFGHAFKGQHDAQALLKRFKMGGGTLLDLEYLVDDNSRRLAAFGYWAGFAGAAVSLLALAAQYDGQTLGPVSVFSGADNMVETVANALGSVQPSVLVVGALGRVGTGARDLCHRVGLNTTDWDIAETSRGAPFPEILAHDVFLNCILAKPGCPEFVPSSAIYATRSLSVIGDIACDPGSDYNPIPIYDRVTSWAAPVIRVSDDPILDVMAIDNLPSLLPVESSQDFAGQLLPLLVKLGEPGHPVWKRARAIFDENL